jgi:hypothetical protein
MATRFFFHLHDGERSAELAASVHADFAAARQNAVRLLGEQLIQSPERFDQDAYWRMELKNEKGLTLTILHVSEVSSLVVGHGRRSEV